MPTNDGSVYLGTLSPPHESAHVWIAADKCRKARTKILNYYTEEYAHGGVDVDLTQTEWVGDESYAWLDGDDIRSTIEVREVEYVE